MMKIIKIIGWLLTAIGLLSFLKVCGNNWDRLLTRKQEFEYMAGPIVLMLLGNFLINLKKP